MIDYVYVNADRSVIGDEAGLDIEREFDNYAEKIRDIIANLNSNKDKPGHWLQWMNLGYNEETVWYVKEFTAMVEGRFDNILILGIGGSALGARAISEALLKPYWNLLSKEQRNSLPKIFFLDNIDPDQINGLLNILDLKKTLVNVITKSGSTAETMSQFMLIKDMLEKELGDDYRKNIIATTDKEMGVLKQLADQEGYKIFYIPDDISGRFSVFSAVGLLPLSLVGIDIDKIIQGIKDMDLALKNTDIRHNIAAQNALIHYLMFRDKHISMSVMMPYSSRLKYVPDWYVQLWAESMGKEYDKDGNRVRVGQTPVKAVGATDQHSLLQLLTEGPNDKIVNFIKVKEHDNEIVIPQIFEYTSIGYLGGKTFNRLLEAEENSTRISLNDYNKPNVTFILPKIDEYHLGQLFYLLEVQTAIAGELYNIDTFAQSGVEQSKNYIYALMDRVGYEDSREELETKLQKCFSV